MSRARIGNRDGRTERTLERWYSTLKSPDDLVFRKICRGQRLRGLL
jgi:hypothetical protein